MGVKTYDPRNIIVKFNGVKLAGYSDGSFVQYAPTQEGLAMAMRCLGWGIGEAFLSIEEVFHGSSFPSVEVLFNRFLTPGERDLVEARLDDARPAGIPCRIVELGTPEREVLWRLGGL